MRTKLLRFTVSGYRNFGSPVTVDFSKVHDYKFNTECVEDGVITKMGIFGPNGSGKSNLGLAMSSIILHLTDKYAESSFFQGVFLNADIKTDRAIFRYEFRSDSNEIVLEYHRNAIDSLLREIFIVNGKTIYDYDYKSKKFAVIDYGDMISKDLNFEYLGNNLSILRYIANNSAQKSNSPIRAVMDFVSHMLWFRSVRNNEFIGLETGPSLIDDWIISNGLVGDFNRFLHEICGLDIKLSTAKGINGKEILVEHHKNGDLIFQQVYSSGTAAAELFYFWMKRFNDVSLLFIDEFDAYYHFELADKIIRKLKTFSNMQVIFTSHNTALIANNLLRPDCYLFLKNGKLASYIDKAGGREIREGHNLEKIYRNGGLDD